MSPSKTCRSIVCWKSADAGSARAISERRTAYAGLADRRRLLACSRPEARQVEQAQARCARDRDPHYGSWSHRALRARRCAQGRCDAVRHCSEDLLFDLRCRPALRGWSRAGRSDAALPGTRCGMARRIRARAGVCARLRLAELAQAAELRMVARAMD